MMSRRARGKLEQIRSNCASLMPIMTSSERARAPSASCTSSNYDSFYIVHRTSRNTRKKLSERLVLRVAQLRTCAHMHERITQLRCSNEGNPFSKLIPRPGAPNLARREARDANRKRTDRRARSLLVEAQREVVLLDERFESNIVEQSSENGFEWQSDVLPPLRWRAARAGDAARTCKSHFLSPYPPASPCTHKQTCSVQEFE